MKKEDVKVGMRVVFEGSKGTVCDIECEHCEQGVWVKWDGDGKYWIEARHLEVVQQPFPLANTKINVQKYAKDNGLTFEAACHEVSKWAASQGYKWRDAAPVCTFRFLFTDTFVNGELTYSDSAWHFDDHPNKEITLSRKATVELTPSFVEVEKPAVEYVELGGKRYIRKDLEEALSKIKAVEE